MPAVTGKRPGRRPFTYIIEGGANLVEDPPTLLPPGTCLDGALNMECLTGPGLRRCDGYERIDGAAGHKASTATYKQFSFISGGPAAILAGNTVTGGTSGATGYVTDDATLDSGAWGAGDGIGTVRLVVTAGVFVYGEALLIAAADRATLTSAGSPATRAHARYKEAMRGARAYVRSLCTRPAGSGKILGTVNDGPSGKHYAFRNNAGGTAAGLWKATAAGWVAVVLKHEVAFTVGNGSIAEGQVITQGANTSTIRRVVIRTGFLAAGTARGILVIDPPAPGNFAAGAAVTSGGGTLTLSGANAQIAIAPNGKYEFEVRNFFGATNLRRIYGADGENRLFEIDPTNDLYVPIPTGMVVDKPTHIATHLSRLWAMFRGGSLQWSDVNGPYGWSVIIGAGELGLGDEPTAIRSLRKDALAVYGRDSAAILYGASFAVADFVPLLKHTGSVPYTVNQIGGSTIALDNIGVYFLEAAQAYGDFTQNSVSNPVMPLMQLGARSAIGAVVVRKKSQYRVYFSDRTGVTATFKGTKLSGWMPFKLGHQLSCVWAGEDTNGDEVIYAGTEDGYVVQLDSGTSHDGVAYKSLIPLSHTALGNSKQLKRFFAITPQIEASHPFTLDLLMEYDFGLTRGDSSSVAVAGPSIWGTMVWSSFTWGAPSVGMPIFDLDGMGSFARPIFRHEDDIDEPWTIKANTIEWEPMGMVR